MFALDLRVLACSASPLCISFQAQLLCPGGHAGYCPPEIENPTSIVRVDFAATWSAFGSAIFHESASQPEAAPSPWPNFRCRASTKQKRDSARTRARGRLLGACAMCTRSGDVPPPVGGRSPRPPPGGRCPPGVPRGPTVRRWYETGGDVSSIRLT